MKKINKLIYRSNFLIPGKSFLKKDYAIVCDSERIIDKGYFENIYKKYSKFEVIEATDKIIIPPFVNAHTHLELTNIQKEDLDFTSYIDWVISLIKNKKEKTEDFFLNSYIKGLNQLNKYGNLYYGNIASDFLFNSKIDTKFNFMEIICYKEECIDEVILKLKKFSKKIKISPHSIFSVHPQLIRFLFKSEFELAIHLFESKDEIKYLEKFNGDITKKLYPFTGLHPIKDSIDIIPLLQIRNKKTFLIHLCYMNEEIKNFFKKELRFGRENYTIIPVLCPRSNIFLKNTPNFNFFINNNLFFTLGTDSLCSNNDLNVLNEAKFIYDQLKNQNKKELLAIQLFNAITTNGYIAFDIEPYLKGSKFQALNVDYNQINSFYFANFFEFLIYEQKYKVLNS